MDNNIVHIWDQTMFYEPKMRDFLPIYIPSRDPWIELVHAICLESAYCAPDVFSEEKYTDRESFIEMLVETSDEK